MSRGGRRPEHYRARQASAVSFATHGSAGNLGGDVGELGLKLLAVRVLAEPLRSRHADLSLGLLLESREGVNAGRLLLGARRVAQRRAVGCSSCLLAHAACLKLTDVRERVDARGLRRDVARGEQVGVVA